MEPNNKLKKPSNQNRAKPLFYLSHSLSPSLFLSFPFLSLSHLPPSPPLPSPVSLFTSLAARTHSCALSLSQSYIYIYLSLLHRYMMYSC
ncbi:hypothetical protein GGR50DRAFT_638320 [Xylaria sp. CBS 124048]|nr:hypothetical protein GGR50DRAFT_638320 [Xylaria sp. CBS 124048]